jgi:MYXO-CTERM domain-containing protein
LPAIFIDGFDPADGSGAEIGGVGLVFILAVVLWRRRDPAFFRGETLRYDTPALIVPE